MKLTMLFKRVFSYLLLVVFISSSSWALYPEKDPYPYKKSNFGVYMGFAFGASASDTFDLASSGDYVAVYAPTRTLSSAVSSISMGMRLFDLRFEGEYINYYQWYGVMNNTIYHTQAIVSTSLPAKGQEVLVGFAANFYYDMRFISRSFYPYIGFGVGRGHSKFLWIDTVLQPNGLGENYHASVDLPFSQLMIGLQYDLRVIKSSFSVEYRATKTSSLEIVPFNDGLHDINSDDYLPGNENSLYPNAEDWIQPVPKNISSVFHSVIFSLKYYLY